MSPHRPESLGYLHDMDDFTDAVKPFASNKWCAEAKYNGWRATISEHGLPISRHGKTFSADINEKFKPAIDSLRQLVNWDYCKAVDCEMLTLTPASCTDTIVCFDCIGGNSEGDNLYERREGMWRYFRPLPFFNNGIHKVFVPESYDLGDDDFLKEVLRQMLIHNQEHDLLYEGFVFKKLFAQYGARNSWFKLRFQLQKLLCQK